jgi:hypothetical protein
VVAIGNLQFVSTQTHVAFGFLGAFVKLRKVSISFMSCLSGSLSAWNNLAATGRAFIKFGFRKVFENLSKKIQVFLKSDKNKEYFT